MDSQEKERDNYTTELINYLIGRLGVCNGYDYWTREELIEELREYEAGYEK